MLPFSAEFDSVGTPALAGVVSLDARPLERVLSLSLPEYVRTILCKFLQTHSMITVMCYGPYVLV